ncbi:MAG: hypothetical protein JO258_20225, partial [Alphaproteobacteria bacterium]|nr:hypothetical protein [Alphaproteobacteria bacterium]
PGRRAEAGAAIQHRQKVGFKKGTSEEAFRLADVIMERRYSTQPVHQV